MRSSRLLSFLLLLQSRDRMTARAVAAELDVSLRTIYRDADALSAAGVPIYAERGPAGGFRLLDGYRTRLTGLTGEEAAAIFLAGLPGPAAELGFGVALAAAQLKLLAALPAARQAEAARLRERFLLDAPGWYHDGEPTPYLSDLVEAVWQERPVAVRYRRWGGEVERRLEPLAVVLKGGVWYLVAAVDGQTRTYRVSRILSLEPLAERFERPADFDLAVYWEGWAERFQREMYRSRVTLRASAEGLGRLAVLFGPAVARAAQQHVAEPDADGWRLVEIPVESLGHAALELLKLGAEAEVVSPIELREQLAATAAAMARVYQTE